MCSSLSAMLTHPGILSSFESQRFTEDSGTIVPCDGTKTDCKPTLSQVARPCHKEMWAQDTGNDFTPFPIKRYASWQSGICTRVSSRFLILLPTQISCIFNGFLEHSQCGAQWPVPSIVTLEHHGSETRGTRTSRISTWNSPGGRLYRSGTFQV